MVVVFGGGLRRKSEQKSVDREEGAKISVVCVGMYEWLTLRALQMITQRKHLRENLCHSFPRQLQRL